MERNGTIAVIIGVVVILVGTEIAVRYLEPAAPDLSKFNSYIDSLDGQKNIHPADELYLTQDTLKKLFKFNPNTLSDSGFTALGFSENEIRTMRSYMKKAGDFKSVSHFRVMNFFDDDRFARLRSYIELPNETEKKGKSEFSYTREDNIQWSDTADVSMYKYNPVIADLNKSDTTELKNLPGIGSYYAKMIVQTRKDLGGFHTIAQLMELRNMTSETIDKIAGKVSIDQSLIIKIKINRATAQELSVHKYISFDLANRIVRSREELRAYQDIEDMVKRGLLDAELRVKLAPYLVFD